MSSSVSLSCSCARGARSRTHARRRDASRCRSPPGVLGLPAGSAALAGTDRSARCTARRRARRGRGRRRLRLRWSVCTVEATTRRTRWKRWGPDSVLVPLGRQSRMSPARSNQESVVSAVESRRRALAGGRGRGICGPWSRSGRVVSGAGWGPVQSSVSAAPLGRAVCLPLAASSAPTQRGGQALPCGSLPES
jgi:hypothetical protein